jgi:integrase/recombinase XerD
MRANELLSLDVGDVDILKMEIRLKPTTKRSNRLLFFDEEAATVLGAWLRARPLRSTHGGDALFPSKTTYPDLVCSYTYIAITIYSYSA